jgi:hypothetical protein
MFWTLWMISHALPCIHFLYPGTTWLARSSQQQNILPVALSLDALVLLYCLFARTSKDNDRQVALLAAFVLGVTPLGLAGLSFATALGNVRHTLQSDESAIDLSSYQRRTVPKFEFIVAIDISQSVLPRKGPSNQKKQELCATVQRIFRSDSPSILGPRLQDRTALVAVHFFAERPLLIGTLNFIPAGDKPMEQLAHDLCKRFEMLPTYTDSDTRHTDLMQLLAELKDDVVAGLRADRRVVLLLISDFLHDPGSGYETLDGQLAQLAQEFEREDTLVSRNDCPVPANREAPRADAVVGPRCTRFTVLGLHMPRPSTSTSEQASLDIRPLIQQRLPDHWQELELADVLAASPPYDRLLVGGIASLERRVDVEETLYLRYEPDRDVEGHVSSVSEFLGDAPSGTEYAVSLRARPDHGSVPTSVQLRFRVDDGPPVALPLSDASRPAWVREQSEPRTNRLSIWVASPLDVSRALRLELLLHLPDRSLVYAIPTVVLPTPGSGSRDSFRWVVWFFAASCGLFFAYNLYLELGPHFASHSPRLARDIASKLAKALSAAAGALAAAAMRLRQLSRSPR